MVHFSVNDIVAARPQSKVDLLQRLTTAEKTTVGTGAKIALNGRETQNTVQQTDQSLHVKGAHLWRP